VNRSRFKITRKVTASGNRSGEFVDAHGRICKIRESVTQTSDPILWLGVEKVVPQRKIGERWVDLPVPHDVINTGMTHLTQDMLGVIIPVLLFFYKEGRLPYPTEPTWQQRILTVDHEGDTRMTLRLTQNEAYRQNDR